MKVYCIVWCCHLLTVQESGDQSLSSVFLFFFMLLPFLDCLKKIIKKRGSDVNCFSTVQLLFR